MDQRMLTDKNQFPSDEIIFSHIGKNKKLWIELFDSIQADHPDFAKEWRYYNDGKSWLLKVTRKTKTIFWLSVIQGTFRITFYFTDKSEKTIEESPISAELKDKFKSGKHYNKIRGLTISFADKKDLEYAKTLISIKLNAK